MRSIIGVREKKTPYEGMWIFIPVLILPSVVFTVIFYSVISHLQPQYSTELNLASAKILGCGIGILFHISCWLTNVFTEDFLAVKERLREFSENIAVSLSLALKCYIEDVRTLGLAFWIDLAVVAGNIWIFADALLTYLSLR